MRPAGDPPGGLVQLSFQALDLLLQAVNLPLQAVVLALQPLGVSLAPRHLPLEPFDFGVQVFNPILSAFRSAVVTPTLCHNPEICTTVKTLTARSRAR